MNAVAITPHSRVGYIGGGNVAGILGCSPYKSPLDEFLTITGQAEPEDGSREAFFKRRKALEPFAAEVFEQRTGLTIVQRNVRYTDVSLSYLRAEIDFEASDGNNGETKTVHPLAAGDWGDEGTDEIPVYVTAQAMHGLMVTGKPGTWVHALIGLDDDRVFYIERDEETIAAIRAREVAFWDEHVVTMLPPDPVSKEDLRRLFLQDAGSEFEADSETLIAINRLRDIAATVKPLEKEFEALKHQVQLAMREAAVVTVDGKPMATWKTQSARRFDQTAFGAAHPDLLEQFKATSQSRVFRLK